MNILAASLTIFFIGSALAGDYEHQEDVPPNHDCSCDGYEEKADECDWPELKCDPESEAYKNYNYSCSKLNNFRNNKREGNINDHYNRTLTCQANMSVEERTASLCGIVVPDVEPTPRSLPAYVALNESLPTAVNHTAKMTPIKNQGGCGSCWWKFFNLI